METSRTNTLEIKHLEDKTFKRLMKKGKATIKLWDGCPCGSGKRFVACCYKPGMKLVIDTGKQ